MIDLQAVKIGDVLESADTRNDFLAALLSGDRGYIASYLVRSCGSIQGFDEAGQAYLIAANGAIDSYRPSNATLASWCTTAGRYAVATYVHNEFGRTKRHAVTDDQELLLRMPSSGAPVESVALAEVVVADFLARLSGRQRQVAESIVHGVERCTCENRHAVANDIAREIGTTRNVVNLTMTALRRSAVEYGLAEVAA